MDATHHKDTLRVVIAGGGISGLAAAHRLAERNADSRREIEIVLLEAGARLGGVIRTERRDGFLLEGGADSFISEKPEAIDLAKRIGLAPHLIETTERHRRSFIVRGRKLLPVPEGFHLLAPSRFWPFIMSEIFSWSGKARMALDLLLPRRSAANGTDDESLARFVRRRLGREALERMAQPMVGGIYTADPEQLSLRATMPRFLQMEREDRSLIRAMWKQRRKQSAAESRATSGARYSFFLSFDEGMQLLIDTLVGRLKGVSVRLNTKVESLAYDEAEHHWQVHLSTGETMGAHAVCLALPAYAAANVLRQTDDDLSAQLEAIPYASTATINLAYKRDDIPHPLDGFGFVVPAVERRATLACTFSSVKFDGRAPEGGALLRAFVGGALQPEMFALDEDAMVLAVRTDLRELLGIEKPPLFARVEKWPRSMAQYHVGHIDRVEHIRKRLGLLRGLSLAGNAYSGAGLPDCIRSGESAAEEIITFLGDGPDFD
ncbi:MAG: protoporphyrinogen/coproporphyrinogen oxidase [Acidobacteriota bacterium]|jgi:oxygen-dependent protoporphyrinogen oxidase|nr:protoporphyrinogen/coproporphyrinogen oxidase [Acidobacteriota bacterium]